MSNFMGIADSPDEQRRPPALVLRLGFSGGRLPAFSGFFGGRRLTTSAANETRGRIRGLCPNGAPVVDSLKVQLELFLFTLRLRLIRAEYFIEATVATRGRLGDNHAVERMVACTVTL